MNNGLELKDMCYGWLEMKRVNVRNSTYSKYKWIVESKIIPFFEDYDVDTLNETAIRNFIDILNADKKYKYNFLNLIRGILFSIIRHSEKKYGLKHIDLIDIKLPVKKTEAKVLTKEQERNLASYLNDHANFISIAISLGLYAGLRVGEVCALKWQDIDLEDGVIYVNRTIQRIRDGDESPKSQLVIGDPKTISSKRKIAMPDFLKEYLISYHIKGENKNFVITNDEKMIDPARVEYQFKIVCSQYGFKINFHALRHTFATNCVKSEIDIKTISEMLGHSNVSITLNRYVHSNLEFQKIQMKKIKNPFTCKV